MAENSDKAKMPTWGWVVIVILAVALFSMWNTANPRYGPDSSDLGPCNGTPGC
jgi:hypothetical protein